MQRRSHPRTLRGRLALAALLPLIASTSCGGSTSEPTQAPGLAARIVVVTPPATTGAAGAPAGDFVVRVEDSEGRGVPGVRVGFAGEGPVSVVFTSADSVTDATGVARAAMTMARYTGTYVANAKAQGIVTPARVEITVTPGPPEGYYLSLGAIRLYGAGDTASLNVRVRDIYGNVIPGVVIGFQVSDSTLLRVTPPAVPGGNALVSALRGGGDAQITITGGPEPWLFPVTVSERARDACTGVSAPQDVPLGALATASGSQLCLAASAGGEYALIVYNGSTDGASAASTTVTAYNIEPDALAARVPFGLAPALARSPATMRRVVAPRLDLRFHERLLSESRSLRRLFAPARAARSRARVGATGMLAGPRPSYALDAGASPTPTVDDLLSLNVATASCMDADMRTFRVEAVGAKAIVLADTANPADGFSRSWYQRIAARFDTLVFPLDRDAFGEPSDIDGNGHVAILFTRAVNELTPANAGSYVGGFFHPRDLFPRAGTATVEACATSNEGEMFYMMVPDPLGVVNGNKFTRGTVDTLATGILAHEFQHLINASRRLYVNTSASDFEETWLDEGLSHVAEELLYFRESRFTPRSRLTSQAILDSRAHFDTWVADDASNFVRFYLYLLDPANHSPIDAGDALETRGATWAFLRFAVDQSFASDADVWQRFANSTTTGFGTLAFGLQRDPEPLLRSFAIANSGGALADPRLVHPSWNYRDVFTEVFDVGAYPLAVGRLKEATAVAVSARGGSAGYYRFAAPPGVQTLLTFGSSESPPSGTLSFMVVRTTSTP